MSTKTTLFQKLDTASLMLLVLTMCTQVDVRSVGRDTLAEGLGYATKTLKVALCDAVFAAVLLWFVVRVIQTRSWRKLWWPPLPCWALIFALVVATIHSVSIQSAVAESLAQNGLGPRAFITIESKEAIAEILQWTGYFLLAPWLFVNLLLDRRDGALIQRRKPALLAFFVAIIGVLLASWLQLASFDLDSPRGLFASPNMLGAFLAVAGALLSMRILAAQPRAARPVQFVLGALAASSFLLFASVVVSPWVLLALGGASLLGSLLLRAQPTRTGAFLVFGALFLWLGWNLNLSQPIATARAEAYRVSSETQAVKKQFVEWQAAVGWNTPRERAFATGVGPGNYQGNIGPLYASLPNEEKLPPDSNNLYLVQAVSIGVLGLGTLLWTVGYFLSLARQATRHSQDWLGVGVTVALTSWLFVNFFHAMIVRGAGLMLAFLFALAVVAHWTTRNQSDPKSVTTHA